MNEDNQNRGLFSGKLGFVLAAAGASVGLGNIWRFPYLAAKYGGGVFLVIYLILAFTFGYTMIMAESAIGRLTGKSPVGAFGAFSNSRFVKAGGWINAIIPILIVPYYSVIGGWVLKYLWTNIRYGTAPMVESTFFTGFISNGWEPFIWFCIFAFCTLIIIFLGVEKGIERVTKTMMPVLVILALIITAYSVTRPGATAGIRYFFIPDFSRFSWMTVVTALGQMFYSLSIAMGILITFGSYMKKDVSIEQSTEQVEVFDTIIAVMAGLMIIPAVFAFSGADAGKNLNAGPSLMFITMPSIFDSMGIGRVIAIMFFLLVFLAALTSSIALTESAASTFEDELGWNRRTSTLVLGVIMISLGALSALGYGTLSNVTIIGMQFLDFFDFLTNSVMMPIAAIAICLLVTRVISVEKIIEEIEMDGMPFRRKKLFCFMIKGVSPALALIILISSVANAFGIIKM
ncbi:MAG: sodium-dependent transporter [Lachnospiraceae bacterium]|nr:sodium-dependent transporter [Lachnospiraceae bacterium]